jgi:hypothetical protein
MSAANVVITRLVLLGAALLSAFLLVIAPSASATAVTFGAIAQGSVSGGIGQNCGGNNGGDGFLTASFSCGPVNFATVDVSVGFGAASVSTEFSNINADVAGTAEFFVQGTIGGTGQSGTMTWTDSGISASGGGNVFLTMYTRGGPFGTFSVVVGSVCFEGPGVNLAGCGAATPISAIGQVTNGEPVELVFLMNCGGSGVGSGMATGSCNISDAMSLSLTNGLTFNSDVPNLFGGPGGVTTPEPSSLLLLASGLLSFAWLRRKRLAL